MDKQRFLLIKSITEMEKQKDGEKIDNPFLGNLLMLAAVLCQVGL